MTENHRDTRRAELLALPEEAFIASAARAKVADRECSSDLTRFDLMDHWYTCSKRGGDPLWEKVLSEVRRELRRRAILNNTPAARSPAQKEDAPCPPI